MNDQELLLKARELLAIGSIRDALERLPLLEGGKGEKAVQDELPLATPVPPVDWKAVYANEATKFRAETIRTSELTAMVKRCVSVLIDDHPPGPWSRGCIRCKIVEDAEELLARPINVAAIPLYTAPQPAAQQPAGDGGALDGKWYLGALNDGLFISDLRPSASGTDIPPDWGTPANLVLNVVKLTLEQAQAIVDAHNAAIAALRANAGDKA